MSVPCVWALTDMSKTFCSFGALGCVFVMSLISCTDKCWCSAFSLAGARVSRSRARHPIHKRAAQQTQAKSNAIPAQCSALVPVLERHGDEQLLGGGQEHGVAAAVLSHRQRQARAFGAGSKGMSTRHSAAAARAIMSYLKALGVFLNMLRGSCRGG